MLAFLQNLLAQYGYIIVALGILLESMGIPLPGETLLLLGAAYAGTGNLNVWGVILAAALGAIVGDNLGYAIGARGGRSLLERYGHVLHLNKRHLAYAEDFFARHGDKTVFFGRFIAILRTFSALLAGVYRMPYRRFLLFNAAGGILWALTFGLLGAAFGSQWPLIERWAGRAGLLILGVLALIAVAIILWRWAVNHEEGLRSRWNAFLTHPRAMALRTRFAPQLAFLQARLSPTGYLGLQLTIGIACIIAGAWLFGGITEDILHGDPLVQVDLAISQFLHAHSEPPFTVAMVIVSLAGSELILIASLALGVYFAWRRRWREFTLLVIGVGGGELLNLALKAFFARQRPTFTDPILTLTTYSFPSGHAMASMIFYSLLVYLIVKQAVSWRLRVLAVITGTVLILIIGFSRMYLGLHYLSDVLGGYAAGLVWLAFTIIGVETFHRSRLYTSLPTTTDPQPPRQKVV
jgi:membrane protein DedA with SNARE-associated domain/membrane-associated phospholipid phosphatase